jgi:hypothetical protein
VINFASDKRFGLVILGQMGSRLCVPISIIHRALSRDLSVIKVLFLLKRVYVGNLGIANEKKS